MNNMNPTPGNDPGLPSERLMTAISIVQSHILADESRQDGKETWGLSFMRTTALEAAMQIMIGLLHEMDPLDHLADQDKKGSEQ